MNKERSRNVFTHALHHFFIDGLSAMAQGLFCTLIIGTILAQIASYVPGVVGGVLASIASLAKALTGAGIGVATACRFRRSPMVTVSAGVAGLVGAFASTVLAGNVVTLTSLPGEPLGAFLAAFAAEEIGTLVSGKTKLDILVTPLVTILSGASVGLLVGPPVSALMNSIGAAVNWGTEQQPLLMGIVVAVLMGLALTLPISSAAIGVSLGLSGLAAGAAVVGCACQMVGFAVASFRENKFSGLIAQGIGTSMLQIPNIMRHPQIWVPATLTGAILGPIATCVFQMTCNATGAGMGTSGLVGPIMTYQTMTASGTESGLALLFILLLQFILPAILSLGISEAMRKLGWIRRGWMKLD
ncbi:MAG: PTS sugar transporter subunit IIC [Clostridia bacterium]|nr:PTS sugar transporter subunit IIC [Clostridia bacterium]